MANVLRGRDGVLAGHAGLAGLALLLVLATTGCGDHDETAATPRRGAPEASPEPALPPPAAIAPCELLTLADARAVLPGAKEGIVSHDGKSLQKGIRLYQCTYANDRGAVLVVGVRVAEDRESIAWTGASEISHGGEKRVDVGEKGWLRVDENRAVVTAVHGWCVAEVALTGAGAGARGDALVDLAKRVVDHLP